MRSAAIRHFFSLTVSLTLIVSVLSGNLTIVAAAGGDFDNTFDGNGRLATDFGGEDIAEDVAIQANGKIVAVGGVGATGGFAVARYNTDGSPDITFSGDGKVITQINGAGSASAVAIQSDGKIVVVGSEIASTGGAGPSFVIVRYNTNGSLDTTFGGGDGIIDGGGTGTFFTDVTIQADGKIVAVGGSGSFSGGVANWLVRRYTTTGGADATFTGGGSIDFGGNSSEFAAGVRVLPNGKTLVGGTANPGGTNFGLALLTTNGSLDTGFDGDGKVITDLPGTNDSVQDIQVQSDGKIILAGSTGLDTALARYNANGTLDTTFDGDGVLVIDVMSNSSERARQIALQPDGKIVIVCTGGFVDFFILRLNTNGGRDPGFGDNGLVVSDMTTGSTDRSNAVALQTDRKIVVAGSTLNTTTTNFCLARYLPGDGAPFDFDGDGKSDVSVWRPSNGTWYVARSGLGDMYVQPWGLNGDVIVPEDYDGDGKADLAVRRPSDNNFYVFNSLNSTVEVRNFGIAGDLAVPADYNGDGKADVAVWRPSNGTWYLSLSGSGIFYVMPWGLATDKPVPGDFDGDGNTELAVWRPSDGRWYRFSTITGTISVNEWGINGDRPVQGDYNGDGRTDFAVYRPSNNTWYRQNSNDGAVASTQWGLPNDFPVPGDYDGDGRIDIAVWRPSDATWYVNRSTSGAFTQTFGVNGDTPTPSAYVR